MNLEKLDRHCYYRNLFINASPEEMIRICLEDQYQGLLEMLEQAIQSDNFLFLDQSLIQKLKDILQIITLKDQSFYFLSQVEYIYEEVESNIDWFYDMKDAYITNFYQKYNYPRFAHYLAHQESILSHLKEHYVTLHQIQMESNPEIYYLKYPFLEMCNVLIQIEDFRGIPYCQKALSYLKEEAYQKDAPYIYKKYLQKTYRTYWKSK